MKIKGKCNLMKKNPALQSMLIHLAEEAALPNEIDLWPTIQVCLAEENIFSKQRKPEMNVNHTHKKRFRALAATMLTLLLVLGALFGLPQSRVWAQNILQFFIHSTNQIVLPTPIPINLVIVTPGVAQSTLTPAFVFQPASYDTCGNLPAPRCSIDQVSKLVDYPVKSFATLPEGMVFIGAIGGEEGITSVYRRANPENIILLMQSRQSTADNQLIPVGSSALIEQVQIGGVAGEYVKGTYFYYGGDRVANWDPKADTQSLRWQVEDMVFAITAYGSNGPDKTDLVNLASGLTDKSVSQANKPTQTSPKSTADIEKEAGFHIIEPKWLPGGYQFARFTYLAERKIVCLIYSHPSDIPIGDPFAAPSPTLSIAESAQSPLPNPEDLIVPGLKLGQALLEKADLQVGGARENTGYYAYGSLDTTNVCGGGNQNQMLEVQIQGLNLAILAEKSSPFSETTNNKLTQQKMVKIAESISGVHNVAESQKDTELLTSIKDVKDLVGFPIKFPTQLPKGMNFISGQIKKDGLNQMATLNYGDGNQVIVVSQTKGSQETLDTITQKDPLVYRRVTIHNQPAVLSQGYWADNKWKELPNGGDGGASVTWFEDGIKYSVGGFNAYSNKIWLEIAESLK